MRLAFFNLRDIKNPLSGGAEVFLHQIGRRLVRRGHEVSIFTSSFKNSSSQETIDGVSYVRYAGEPFMHLTAPLCYSRHVKGRFDAVIDSVNGLPFFTPLYAKEPVIPLVHRLVKDDWHHDMPAPLAFLGPHLEKPAIRLYKERPCVVPSVSAMSDMEDLGFKRLGLIHGAPSITPPKKRTVSSGPAILYLGRLTKSKRLDHALLAFRHIMDSVPDARFWIAGSGPDEQRLRSRVARANMGPWVTFFGHVNEQQKARLLSASHLMFFPAESEGCGLAILEANACGTPVLGYDLPGLRESVLDGVNGFLVEDGQAHHLAERAISLLTDKRSLKRLAGSAKKHSSGFSWEKSASRFESIVENSIRS